MSLTFKITTTDYDNDHGILSGSWSTSEKVVPFYLYKVIHQAVSIFVLAESEADARSQVSCGTPSIAKYATDATVVCIPFRIRGHSGLVFGGPSKGKWRDATLADLEAKVDMKARFFDHVSNPSETYTIGLLGGYRAGSGWYRRDYAHVWKHCQVWEPTT